MRSATWLGLGLYLLRLLARLAEAALEALRDQPATQWASYDGMQRASALAQAELGIRLVLGLRLVLVLVLELGPRAGLGLRLGPGSGSGSG